MKEGSGVPLTLRLEDMLKLGIAPSRATMPAGGARVGSEIMALADAGNAAKNLVGKWKKFPSEYRRVAEALDQAGIGDPAAREAYRWGSGTIQYLNATKALVGEKFHPENAMAGLVNTKTWEMLRRRGMQSFAKTIRGAEHEPITSTSPTGKGLIGGIAGAAAGSATGHPWIGYYAGKEAGKALWGPLRGVQTFPSVKLLQRVGPLAGGAAGSEAAEALQAPRKP